MLVKTDNKGKEQWWDVDIDVEQYAYIRHCIGVSKMDTQHFLNKVDAINKVHDFRATLVFNPLISKDGGVDSYLNYRGYENDTEPFVFRNRNLPMVKAEIFTYSGDNKKQVSYNSNNRSVTLTSGQSRFLHQLFDEQLLRFHNNIVIEQLKREAIKGMVSRMLAQINDLEKELVEFKKVVKSVDV